MILVFDNILYEFDETRDDESGGIVVNNVRGVVMSCSSFSSSQLVHISFGFPLLSPFLFEKFQVADSRRSFKCFHLTNKEFFRTKEKWNEMNVSL